MTDEQIKHMVDRFLGWRLPENFTPDAGISFARTYNEHTPYPMKHEPVGTNLFDASQAENMVRYMVEGMPGPQQSAEPVAPKCDAMTFAILNIRSKLFQKFLSQGFWHAHHVDLVWRYNGQDVREEADWLKDLWYAVRGVNPSPPPQGRRWRSYKR